MKKLMLPLLLSLALCSGMTINNNSLIAMKLSDDRSDSNGHCSKKRRLDDTPKSSFYDSTKKTLLLWAIRNNHPQIVRSLLLCRVDPNTQCDDDFESALMVAIRARYYNPGTGEEVIKALLTARTDLDVRNSSGETALMLAVRYNDFNIVKLLLEAQANPNLKNSKGQTALMIAILHSPNEFLVRLLLDAHANPNIQDRTGNTPLMWAAFLGRSKEMVWMLLRSGADKDRENLAHHNVYFIIEHSPFKQQRKDALIEILNIKLPPLPQNPEKQCGICCEEDGGEFTLLEPCGHYFHTGCINNWFRVKESCPFCRAEVIFHDRIFKV